MTGSELHDGSRRAEDDYFRRRDLELLSRSREARLVEDHTQKRADCERSLLADALGVHDLGVVVALHAEGLRAGTAGLIEWLPAIEVAWIDHLDPHERQELRRQFSSDPRTGDAAITLLTEWLFVPPPHEVMLAARRALQYQLEALDEASRREMLDRIVARCEAVGRASGGLFGLGSLSRQERRRIDDVVEGLDESLASRPELDPVARAD